MQKYANIRSDYLTAFFYLRTTVILYQHADIDVLYIQETDNRISKVHTAGQRALYGWFR